MPDSPEAIANWIIDRSEKSDVDDLTHLKLQKLVYFCHGWSAGIMGAPLASSQVEAWKHGPVFPSLYESCMGFGRDVIEQKIEVFAPETGDTVVPEMKQENAEVLQILESVWDNYSKLSANRLVSITHNKDGPWQKTVSEAEQIYGHLPNGLDIPFDRIKAYFAARYAQNAETQTAG